ncbi:MAG TPA: hypothetical protein VLR91_02480 [Thermodesulfobacteriota bacterium]|nr:hypothetical protein [Thermodesulfobacteriota bacterium]
MNMQNKWPVGLVLVLIWVWAGVLWAGNAQMQVPEPRYDFGELGESEIVSHDFKILNIGDETLQIADVRPG